MDRIRRFFAHGCVGFFFIILAMPVGAMGGGFVAMWLFEGSRMEIPGLLFGFFGGIFLLIWGYFRLIGEL